MERMEMIFPQQTKYVKKIYFFKQSMPKRIIYKTKVPLTEEFLKQSALERIISQTKYTCGNHFPNKVYSKELFPNKVHMKESFPKKSIL